jgi:hypothetical protein
MLVILELNGGQTLRLIVHTTDVVLGLDELNQVLHFV